MNPFTKSVEKAFQMHFNFEPKFLIQAPGRVNLIGEHTDYNDGFVLPCAIDYQAVVGASTRKDNVIHVYSVDYDEVDEFDLTKEITFQDSKMWANYIRGVAATFIKRGYKLGGLNLVVSGNVPQGAGLSSSAALEVVIGQTFKDVLQLDVTQAQIALMGQQAENEFVGCNCGIMDQLVSAEGKQNNALLIDCEDLDTKLIPIPEDLTVLIVNSNKKRGLVDSEYNLRRVQCEEAAKFFGVKSLRYVTRLDFAEKQHLLDPVVAKRAMHVITENERTLKAATALEYNDMRTLSILMSQSHISMRDNFEITTSEIDKLVAIIKNVIKDEGGVRMTGGGFGGCVVALLPHNLVDQTIAEIKTNYERTTGLKESIYLCKAKDGASLVK